MTEEINIPKHWEMKKLGDICIRKDGLRRGPFGSSIKKEIFVPDGYKVYEQSNAIYDDMYRGRYFIDENKYKDLINFNVQPGDFIVSCSGTLGKIAQIPDNAKPGVINQALLRIRIKEEIITKKYFLCFFRSVIFQRKIFVQSQGTAMSNLIGIKDFKEIELPIPPIHEQKAIISKIEELLSDLENGKQQLQTALQQLKIYRQSLLKSAFEGKLTNPNVKSGELPEGWVVKTFNEIGSWKGGGTPSKSRKDFWEDGNILWVSPKDMKSQKIVDTIDKITADAIENSSTKIIPKGSILFVVRSGILRRTLPVALTICEVTVNQDIQAFTPNNVLPEYIYWYVCALNNEIRQKCSKDGTTVESIESSLLKNFPVPVCSYEEQQLIVNELESKLTVCDKLEETITQSLLQSETLKQSILKKAFEGKLVRSFVN
jgi:type I restriction enzyme S subunit